MDDFEQDTTMRFLVLLLPLWFLVSCSTTKTSSPIEESYPSRVKAKTPKKEYLPYTLPEPTREQEKKVSEAWFLYDRALARAIMRIDDGVTDPSAIARAGVSACRKERLDVARMKIAHAKDSPDYERRWREVRAAIPTRQDIDFATYGVLKLRRQKKETLTASDPDE